MSDTIRINTKQQWYDFICSDPGSSMIAEQEHHARLLEDIFNSV